MLLYPNDIKSINILTSILNTNKTILLIGIKSITKEIAPRIAPNNNFLNFICLFSVISTVISNNKS